MAVDIVQCPHCQGKEVVKYGTANNGKARYRFLQNQRRSRTFIPAYTYPGRMPEGKLQISEMTLNGSGVRYMARVLQVSPPTVIRVLKKRPGHSPKSIQSSSRGAVLPL